MAVVNMNTVNIRINNNLIQPSGFEYEDTLSSPGNGDTVIIPTSVRNISVTLEVAALSSGKVQVTTNKYNDVVNNNNVVWVDWDSGEVASTEQDSVLPATAIRQVNVSGTTRMLLRAQ